MESLPVTVTSLQVVKPTKSPPYPISSLRSCSLDLVIANMYVKTVYFYNHNDDSPGFFSDEVVMQALSQALSVYYPIAGTLTADMDIQCNGQGAVFVQATADCTLADLGDLTPHPRLLRLVPTLDASLQPTLQPLLLLQITRFECRGVAIGMALEHHVADGISALNFFDAWTTIARGETLRMYPSFDKTWLRARCPAKPEFTHDEYLKLPKPRSDIGARKLGQEHETVVRMFELPEEFLQRMRRDHGVCSKELTTYEMLAAHVWRCCCKARALRQEEKSMLVMAVDGRVKLAGDDGEDAAAAARRYIGNVIFNCCLSLAVGEIMGESTSLRMLGKRVQAALRRVDEVYCRSAIDFLETCTRQQLDSFVKGAHTFASPNLGFISWANLPFYEKSDFGWGKASHVGPAHVPWEGHAYLLRSSAEGSTLRLCISLQRRHMPTFARLLFLPTPP